MDNQNSDNPKGTISVEEAIQWAANWRSYLASSEQAFVARSFLISINNLKNILLYNPDAESVRAYIGLTDATNPMSAQLMLVPVTNGAEILHLPPNNNGDGDGIGSNVWDLSAVCPPFCPMDDSPLNS